MKNVVEPLLKQAVSKLWVNIMKMCYISLFYTLSHSQIFLEQNLEMPQICYVVGFWLPVGKFFFFLQPKQLCKHRQLSYPLLYWIFLKLHDVYEKHQQNDSNIINIQNSNKVMSTSSCSKHSLHGFSLMIDSSWCLLKKKLLSVS